MKILIICQHYYPEQFRISDIAESLVEAGNKVTVLTGKPNYPEGRIKPGYVFGRRKETIKGVHVIRCPIIPRRSGKIMMLLNYLSFVISASIKSLFMGKFDVIYIYQLNPVTMGLPGVLLGKIKKIPIHLYCLDIWPEAVSSRGMKDTGMFYKCAYAVSKAVYNNVDSISVTSSLFIEYFSEMYPNINKVAYIPQHAENIFKPDKKKKIGKTIFEFAGNIGNLQSVETIIEAANILIKRGQLDFKILIVGDGVSRGKVEKKSIDYGLEEVISFCGNQPLETMPDFYSKADVMLLTLIDSKKISYTLPGKTQSYMAMAKPICAAISGEAKNVIDSSRCGLVVAAEDYESLADIMEKFINTDQPELISMGNNGYEYYQKKFTKEQFLRSTIEELNNISRSFENDRI